VINLSLKSDAPDPRVDAAIADALTARALVVVAAGNDGTDIDRTPSYPASVPAPNLLAVAATSPDEGRGLAEFSNYGTLSVQLAAPGEEILSTASDGGYVVESGTSMAAPMTSGVAALMASANPRIGGVELRSLLLQSATRSQLPVAAGYVDALRAVLAASTAIGYDASQPPRIRVIQATSKGARTTVQVAALGFVAAIKRYVVTLDGRRVARLAARTSPFTAALPRQGRRVGIQALDASGRRLAVAQRRVQALRSGKRGAGTGGRVGT